MLTLKSYPVLHLSVVLFFWSFGIIDSSTFQYWKLQWKLSTGQAGARGRESRIFHFFIIAHVQTQSNRVCNFNVILLWLMLPRGQTFSRILYSTIIIHLFIFNIYTKHMKRHFSQNKIYTCYGVKNLLNPIYVTVELERWKTVVRSLYNSGENKRSIFSVVHVICITLLIIRYVIVFLFNLLHLTLNTHSYILFLSTFCYLLILYSNSIPGFL
jgi:hypothetical protein